MTTYDGRSANYVAGRVSTNTEPNISRLVIEKQYQVHREKLNKIQTLTDSHLIIPDFLVNQSWKLFQAEKKKRDMIKHNEIIYERIMKAETDESIIKREVSGHAKRVQDVKQICGNIKEAHRVKNLLQIQKDNEIILQRIEKAKPIYTLKGMKEWYKPHILYKENR
jgi:hypothetical protein